MRGLEGVKDAAVDIVHMELVVRSDGRKIDVAQVIRAIREAGHAAHPAR